MDKKIGFIGLGAMGKPMATNLVKAGFNLTVYDIRPEPMQELEKLGAMAARSTQEVGEQCDIIETIVVDDAQVEEVVFWYSRQWGVSRSPSGLHYCDS